MGETSHAHPVATRGKLCCSTGMENDDLNQIDRLFVLKEKGVLSDEEFQAEKSRILKQSSEPNAYEGAEVQQPETGQQPTDAPGHDWQNEVAERSRFGADSRVPIFIGIIMTIAFIGGGLFFWRGFPVSAVGDGGPVAPHSGSTNASPPVPQPIPEMSEAQLLKLAFAATIAKQGAGYKPQKLIPVSEDTYAVIATAEGGEAHADAGKLGVQYAKRTGNSFASASPLREVETGSFGQEPAWRIRNDLTASPLVMVEGGGTWQGCTSSTTTLVELGATAPRVLGSVPTSYSYEDEEGILSEYSGVIEQGTGGIQVRYSGRTDTTIPLVISGGTLRPQLPLPKGC